MKGSQSRIEDSRRGPLRVNWDLCRTIAARCRGKTGIVSDHAAELAELIRSRHPESSTISVLNSKGLPAESFDTLILVETLERIPAQNRPELLKRCWNLVRKGGRLIVVVPNSSALLGPEKKDAFEPKSLRKLLRPLARPKLLTTQPFMWLVMLVYRPSSARPRINRNERNRFRVTAKLCRGRVIELGCGEGHLSNLVHRRGHEVVGVDLSEAKIRRARVLYPGIDFLANDIRNISLPRESFDTVILAEVLEHVPEDVGSEILRIGWELVRPGGRFIVSVPNENCIPHPHHVRQFSKRDLAGILETLGKPKLVVEQPFQWLLMRVQKRSTPEASSTGQLQ